MYTKSYQQTLDYVAEQAPDCPNLLPKGTSNNFFIWAEGMASLISFIYNLDYYTTITDLVHEVRLLQDEDYDPDGDDDE